ncbi:MAG: hypothetical protein ABIN94_06820 [Ferruginibacter sp.]
MFRDKRRPAITAVILLLAVLNYTRISGNENIRTVQFLSIFAIGLLSGVLLRDLIAMLRAKRD